MQIPVEFLQKNWPLVLVFIVSGAMLLWPLVRRQLSGSTEIGTFEATRLMNSENPLVLDVRETQDYEGGHLPDAIHIPLSQLAARGPDLAKYAGRTVIVYCDRGMRSTAAASALGKLGFARVLGLRGGIQAWREAGLPTKKG
ncbi:MAG TPA: rhodanese-like domain-containing protein [Casimicrobiaceae bacterium]|nr:rhodanese-like domain-containing protein [Casimicrobiaceae bacterium]